jgi:hypothetical protein
MVLDPQSDCGIINKPKKKNVLQTNEQEQNPTGLSRWLEGVFFFKKDVYWVKPLRLFSLENSRNQGFSEKNAGRKKAGATLTNRASSYRSDS